MKKIISLLFVSIFAVACNSSTSSNLAEVVSDESMEDSPAEEIIKPTVLSMTGGSFYTDQQVVVIGTGLTDLELTINGAPVAISSQTYDELSFIAPDWPAGEYSMVLENADSAITIKISYVDVLKVDSLVSGRYSSCAIVSDSSGSVACWGRNNYGQLGDGSTDDTQTPVLVSDLTNVIDIDVGDVHSCAVFGTGEVACWGDNRSGQLGNGSKETSLTPVTVLNLTDAVSISVGYYHSCALKSDASVVCWGQNDKNQLGDRILVHSDEPVAVDGLSDVVSFSSENFTNCAVKSDGTVACWGQNYQGQLGRGHNDQDGEGVYILTDVSSLTDAVAVDLGSHQACAIKEDGSVVCWGDNGEGQLGAGLENSKSTVPVSVVNLKNITDISLGANISCALNDDKQTSCWGNNEYGQLKNETAEEELNVPVIISSIDNVETISSGGFHVCALHQGDAVSCWGYNQYGQLGADIVGGYVPAP